MGCFDRNAILLAYALYVTLWGPTRYGARVMRLVRLGPGESLERSDSDVKQVYGCIVKREHALWIGFERLRRRMGDRCRVEWPGTQNMPYRDERGWLRSHGLLQGALACIGEA